MWSRELAARISSFAERHGVGPEASAELETLLALARQAGEDSSPTEPKSGPTSPPVSPSGPRPLPPRYEDLGLLGRGGMGEVRRVSDRQLKRTVAMKIIRPELLRHYGAVDRFIEEAQATAQLQHPGIVPVHDLGLLPDGCYYFTMKEVQGRTLRAAILEVHAASPPDRQLAVAPEDAPGWTFRRLVDAFHRVCEAVAYAHERGVTHRDLKPSNVMVGPFGEVLVMDWGLAKVGGRTDPAHPPGASEPVITERSSSPWLLTHPGLVAGTPAYMSPEQARGEVDRVGPTSDVYTLGAILYEILSGRPPYQGSSAGEVLEQVLRRAPMAAGRRHRPQSDLETLMPGDGPTTLPPPAPSPQEGEDPGVPDELKQICARAMAREPAARYPDARQLGAEVGRWLEGALRRERGQRIVKEVIGLPESVRALREEAGALRSQARARLSDVPGHKPIECRKVGWHLEDDAARLEREADLAELHYLQTLRGALMLDPELEDAHLLLADYYRERHQEAEARGETRQAMQFEVLLRDADRRGRHAAWIRGDGALTLVTEPPGAEVDLYRFEQEERLLRSRLERRLGRTPILQVPLARGSYLLEIRAPGRVPVRYPVCIGRGEPWEGRRPGGTESHPIYLPREGELGPDDLYVPAGWTWSGGDPAAYLHLPRRLLWVDGFVMRRFPVTNREYLTFLNDLVARGQEDAALHWVPRERRALADPGSPIYGRDPKGCFVLRPDADGDLWEPGWPVIMVDSACARAYATWQRERSGLPWRIPGELEWEKAARGVDGRLFPWGDHADPAWARMGESTERPQPVEVQSYPEDVSVYGIRGLGGNVMDWCADGFRQEGPPTPGGLVLPPPELTEDSEPDRVTRGGDWYGTVTGLRCASRYRLAARSRFGHIGFRIVRSLG